MNPNNGTNQGRLLWWIVGTATTLGLAVGTGTFANLRNNSERIAVLESQVGDTRRHLQRIERKLDHILEIRRAR